MNLNNSNNNWNLTPEALDFYKDLLKSIEAALNIKLSNSVKLKNIKLFELMYLYKWSIHGIQSYLAYNNHFLQNNFEIDLLAQNLKQNSKDIEKWNILISFYFDSNEYDIDWIRVRQRVIFANNVSKAKTIIKTIKERMEDAMVWGKVLN